MSYPGTFFRKMVLRRLTIFDPVTGQTTVYDEAGALLQGVAVIHTGREQLPEGGDVRQIRLRTLHGFAEEALGEHGSVHQRSVAASRHLKELGHFDTIRRGANRPEIGQRRIRKEERWTRTLEEFRDSLKS